MCEVLKPIKPSKAKKKKAEAMETGSRACWPRRFRKKKKWKV